MKLPFRSALPPLDSTSRLPLLLTVPLLGALAFQTPAADDTDLPPAPPPGRPAASPTTPSPRLAAVGDGRAIVSRSMFAPGAQPLTPGAASSNPASGIAIAGAIRIGRANYAVVQGPGTRIRRVRPGGSIGGWRLSALTSNEALLVRGEERVTVPFGGQPIPAAATTGGETE